MKDVHVEPQHKVSAVRKPEKNKKEKKLSERDLKDLMGTNRDTYKRVGGAVRSNRK